MFTNIYSSGHLKRVKVKLYWIIIIIIIFFDISNNAYVKQGNNFKKYNIVPFSRNFVLFNILLQELKHPSATRAAS